MPWIALSLVYLLVSCQVLPSVLKGEDETPLSPYYDSLLDIRVDYPKGWGSTLKTTFEFTGKAHHLYFTAPDVEWTRRFTVNVVERKDSLYRTMADYRRDFREQLQKREQDIAMEDSGAAVLGGEPGYRAMYTTFLADKRPHVRILEIICRHRGRDYGITFEVAADRADSDILLFERISERFRFYRP